MEMELDEEREVERAGGGGNGSTGRDSFCGKRGKAKTFANGGGFELTHRITKMDSR